MEKEERQEKGPKGAEERVRTTVELDGSLNGALEEIAQQGPVNKAGLIRLGVRLVVEHVRETGELPVPKITLREGEAA